jgi:hypothetical protein
VNADEHEQPLGAGVAGIGPSVVGEDARPSGGAVAGQAGEAATPGHAAGAYGQTAGDAQIASLAGELIPATLGRAGYWAYRLLPNGRLLEVEVTHEEWHRLGDVRMARMNARVDALNQHPLNVAALEALRRARQGPCGPGALRWLHVLSLASLGLPCEDGKEDEPPWTEFLTWVEDVASMSAALSRLEEAGVTADELSSRDAQDAAHLILSELETC